MKKVIIVLVLLVFLLVLSGCNKQILDITYSFDEAIVKLPDESVVRGKLESWTDFEDGDQIQVKIDGVTYLVHSSDVALIHK